MAHIEFLDETIRDGQQSLWGMRLQAGMALPAAGYLDRTGFRVQASPANPWRADRDRARCEHSR